VRAGAGLAAIVWGRVVEAPVMAMRDAGGKEILPASVGRTVDVEPERDFDSVLIVSAGPNRLRTVAVVPFAAKVDGLTSEVGRPKPVEGVRWMLESRE